MTAFYWNWKLYTLGSGYDINGVYNALVSGESGLETVPSATGVEYDGTTVHGQVGKFRVAVLCLPTTGSQFWMIVAVSGDGTETEAQSVLNEAVGQIGIQASLVWGV